MKIVVIGTGYVGLVAGTCLANFGHDITCLDKDKLKIADLKKGKIPIHEPNLSELVIKNIKDGRLKFSHDENEMEKANILIIAVGTPASKDGSTNMKYLDSVVNDIINHVKTPKFIVIKSTVPIGTAEALRNKLLKLKKTVDFDFISNPEFLREGSAVHDFNNPDRIIVGCKTQKAREVAEFLYKPLKKKDVPILFSDNTTAELIKYAANSFLAMRVAFINEIADIAEKAGANIEEISQGIGADWRIGKHYLHAGPGFGGSCFPKDTQALLKYSVDNDSKSLILDAIISANDARKKEMSDRAIRALGKTPKGKRVALLGVAFKADTDDIRDSASLVIIKKLLAKGVKVRAYDPSFPLSINELKVHFRNEIEYAKSIEDALDNSDLCIIATEWNQFKIMDLGKLKKLMNKPKILDFRNLFSHEKMSELKIEYSSVGRKDC